MSDDSIRLELSQERLRRELAKGPANYRAIARAELEVRRSEQALRGENERLERQFRETTRQADRMGRGMLAGSGALRGMGRNLAFASAGFLGGTGLVYGMRNAISAASNLEEQTNKTRVVFKESADEVLAWSNTTSTSIGIASDQALGYAGQIGAILNVTGLARKESARMSKDIVQLAADMASFNNEDPTEMLEALRSGLVGEAEPLRRRGVLLDEATVKGEAYRLGLAKQGEELSQGEKVQARYSLILKQTTDQQGDYARTADSLANSQRTLSALWREANILVGQALAPAFTDAVQGIRDWLAEDRNRAQLQREVNQLVGDGEKVVRGLVDALRLVKTVSEPVVDALGGIGKAVEIVTLLWVGLKVKALLGFGGTAAASKATAASMVRDATVAGRAWDIATRPRVMPVTTVGGGVPVPGGRGGGRIPPVLFGNPALITAGVILSTPGASGAKEGDRRAQKAALFGGEWADQYPALSQVAANVAGGRGSPREVKLIKSLGEPPWSEGKLESAERQARRFIAGPFRDQAGTAPPPKKPPPTTTGGTGPGSFTFKRFEAQAARIEERRLDAEATPSEADDVKIAKEELVLVRRALRELELTRDQRVALKQRRNALLAEIAGAEQEAEQDAQRIRDERTARQKAAAEKRKAAEEKRKQREEDARERRHQRVLDAIEAQEEKIENRKRAALLTDRLSDDKKALRAEIAYERAREQDTRLTAEERRKHKAKRLEAQKELRDLKKKGAKGAGAADEDKPLTEAELRRMLFDFASGLHGVIDQFGSNVGDSAGDYGMAGTQAQLQTLELTRQTRILEEFTGAVRHPMTGYHRTEGTTSLVGVGF